MLMASNHQSLAALAGVLLGSVHLPVLSQQHHVRISTPVYRGRAVSFSSMRSRSARNTFPVADPDAPRPSASAGLHAEVHVVAVRDVQQEPRTSPQLLCAACPIRSGVFWSTTTHQCCRCAVPGPPSVSAGRPCLGNRDHSRPEPSRVGRMWWHQIRSQFRLAGRGRRSRSRRSVRDHVLFGHCHAVNGRWRSHLPSCTCSSSPRTTVRPAA